jgi:hypothetical protein
MRCKICKIDIANEDAQHHLAIHIAQHTSGQKLESIHGTIVNPTDSVLAAFADYHSEDATKKNQLLVKLFV